MGLSALLDFSLENTMLSFKFHFLFLFLCKDMNLNSFIALYHDTRKRQYQFVSISQYLQIEMKADFKKKKKKYLYLRATKSVPFVINDLQNLIYVWADVNWYVLFSDDHLYEKKEPQPKNNHHPSSKFKSLSESLSGISVHRSSSSGKLFEMCYFI